MPRRCANFQSEYEPLKKKSNIVGGTQEDIIKDLTGKEWKFGRTVGVGGFGEIRLASDNINKEVKPDTQFVSKVEKHSKGPLFVEINCYLRIAKEQLIEKYKNERGLSHLGMPHYVASGSYVSRGEKYRFLVIPKYEKDLEQMLQQKKMFNLKTVLGISNQIVSVLEYIHHHGYVHSDIKASNILLAKQSQSKLPQTGPMRHVLRARKKMIFKRRTLRPVNCVNYNEDQFNVVEQEKEGDKAGKEWEDRVFLLDYGLASRFLTSSGEHKEVLQDERRAHAGTVMFCSRDAHKGILSPRSDLECLAYNIIYWLTGSLPWINDVEQPEVVESKKIKCLNNIDTFLKFCFASEPPKFLIDFFNYLNELKLKDKLDYDFCRKLFSDAIEFYGYKNDNRLDFDNLLGWGKKQKATRPSGRENRRGVVKVSMKFGIMRPPLLSNIKRPKLRKKLKNKIDRDSLMNWSKILVSDPEVILRGREKKSVESNDVNVGANVLELDLQSMNPTYAMLEVFNRCKEREGVSPRHRVEWGGTANGGDAHIEGYTPAMMSVYLKKKEQEEQEQNLQNINASKATRKPRAKKNKVNDNPPMSIRTRSRVKIKPQVTSPIVEKRELSRKVKSVPNRRNYSLRG